MGKPSWWLRLPIAAACGALAAWLGGAVYFDDEYDSTCGSVANPVLPLDSGCAGRWWLQAVLVGALVLLAVLVLLGAWRWLPGRHHEPT